MVTEINEKLLDERLAALESGRTWSPRVVSKLENHIHSGEDAELFRINPCSFAAEKGIPEDEAIDIFLHASALGLFEMDWFLLCPLCSCVIDSFRTLRRIDSHCHCNLCHLDFDAALDDQIAIGFTVNPDIRKIIYHNPQQLSAEDYNFQYRSAIEGLIPDETPFTVVKRAITKALAFIEPGEKKTFDVDAEAGALLGTTPDGDATFLFPIDTTLAPKEQHIELSCSEDVCDAADGSVSPGRVVFDITNTGTKRLAFLIWQLPPGISKPPPLHFAPFLSGKRLLTTQTFRELFRSETTGQGLAIKDITLLFTDLKGSTALYNHIGDLNAFSLVQQHFDRLQNVTVRNGGAIIKTIGDAVMAAFRDPAHAVRAALEMREEMGEVSHGTSGRELILKIGLHKGAVIAVTLNDRLDYFGQTVNIAARVQHLADANDIYLSEDVYTSPGVGELLESSRVEARNARLRGVDQEIPVFRIAPQQSPEVQPA
ncbi:MAG: adenylate/guanylate cyclase domain-containing protein [Salaquimonas sp.]|nr:adenylate/guanylate cyclase domain-containing protein [Salaquimonas sp.]